jgi:hypothetical protein
VNAGLPLRSARPGSRRAVPPGNQGGAMAQQGDRPLDHDADGLLYEPDVRDVVGRALPPDRLAAVEAILALQEAAGALTKLMQGVRNSYGAGDPRMRVLMRLHANPAGVPPDEFDAVTVDELARAGMLATNGSVARLTAVGERRMDEALGGIAERLAAATAGLGTDDLAALRHACLTLARNQRQRGEPA